MSTQTAPVTPLAPPDPDPSRSVAALLRASPSRLQSTVTFGTFVTIFLGYSLWLGGTFTDPDARLLDFHQNAPILLLGLGLLMPMVAGQFDLSGAAMATLTTYLTIGLSVKNGWPFALVIVAVLAVGVAGGLLNGLLVVRLRVNAFIATLGTTGVFTGLADVYGGGSQISPTADGRQLPGWFSGLGSLGSFNATVPSVVVWVALGLVAVAAWARLRRSLPAARGAVAAAVIVAVAALLVLVAGLPGWVDGVSWTIALVLVVAALLWVLLSFTVFGRHLRAIGSNADAARLAGVKPQRELMKAYVLAGLLAALAGFVLAANQGAASPDAAISFLLPAFAAVFLSTVLLSNGAFKVWGTVMGGVFLVWVSQGLIVGGLPFTWTDVVNGVVLIAAVAVGTANRKGA